MGYINTLNHESEKKYLATVCRYFEVKKNFSSYNIGIKLKAMTSKFQYYMFYKAKF